jgi:Ca2+/Na+ antiporter
MSTDTILFNVSAFIAGLIILERSADAFVDNTAILAKRLGISEVLVALLTAGAEWEELVVVVASLIQNRPGLAIGNVVGSTISNILGAFSIGLLLSRDVVEFDRSSKLYTGILFVVTTVVFLLAMLDRLGRGAGGVLVAAFAVYIGLIGQSIYRGVLVAPEDSHSDSESDRESDTRSTSRGDETIRNPHYEEAPFGNGDFNECSPLMTPQSKTKAVIVPLFKLLLGLVFLSLSGYILSHASSTLAEAFGILDSVFGVTILSFATTLPEKFVAVFSGARGHSGILVANTVGSNIFLLTLCLGVTLLTADHIGPLGLAKQELAWMWGSSILLGVIVMLGSHRSVGGLMLVAYVAFLILEFTLGR